MSSSVERATKWMYRGVWGILTQWFRVPEQPPDLPVTPGEEIQSFRPSLGFLRYLQLHFGLTYLGFDAMVVIVWLVATTAFPLVGLWLAPLALLLAIVPAAVAYLALHLRYDTTWYVLSRRSLRIRSGIWTINEATITFENIQNVTVDSGPVERWFGIGNVIVDTAGGGEAGKTSHGGKGQNFHQGVIGGVSNASEIRRLILSRLSLSKSVGLGDDANTAPAGWTAEHLAVLREIRDACSTANPRAS